MLTRSLSPGERMTDIFDRAATLNFTTVAVLRGALSEPQLLAALRRLERRHPLLTARIARADSQWSLETGAAQILLHTLDGTPDSTQRELEASLCHRVWDDSGPRAALTWLRNGPDRSTLLLSLHHVVSDGSSGIFAMRDLLELIELPDDVAIDPLPAPAQDSFFPPLFTSIKERFLAAVAAGMPPPEGPLPFRLRKPEQIPLADRRARVTTIRLSREETDALLEQTRSVGATVHGAVCAALSLAIAQEPSATPLQSIAHPVSLRRYLRRYFPETTPIGDAVGYYVSSVSTEHQVEPGRNLTELACEVTTAVRAKLDAHEPLLTAPLRGPYFAERASALGEDAFRELAEQKVFTGTYGVSNLGPLEQLGVASRVGSLEVEEMYFAMASSVMGSLGAAVVSHRGRLCIQLTHVEPMIAGAVVTRVAARLRELLLELGR